MQPLMAALEGRGFAVAKDLLGSFVVSAYVEFEHLFRKGFFAGKVVIKRPFWYVRLVQNLLHAGGCVAHSVDSPQSNLQETIPRIRRFHFICSGSSWHVFNRPVYSMQHACIGI